MKKLALVVFSITMLVSIVGCYNYGYRPYFAGGPHLDYLPEWTFPIITSHRPVPYEELKNVYPPDLALSGQ